MKPVTFPLTTGQSGIEVYNLQQVLLLFIKNNKLNVDDKELINQMRCCEIDKQFFGAATTQLVTLFRAQFGIQTPPVPVVDQAVAERMNAQLPALEPVKVLSGTVQYDSGKPFLYPESYNVNLYAISFKDRLLLDTVTVSSGSFFTYNYSGPELSNGNRGVQAIAEIAGNEFSSEVSYDTTTDITLDITVNSFAYPARSEFEILEQKLNTVLDGNPIDSINLEDPKEMEFLSETTGEDQLPISLMVEAFKWYHIGNLEPLFFYGLFRQNISYEKEILLYQPTEILRRALEISGTNGIIPLLTEEQINSFLNALQGAIIYDMMYSSDEQGPKESATYYIVDYLLRTPDKTIALLKYYFEFVPSDDQPDFWMWLQKADGFYNPFQQQLKAALGVAMLSFSIPAINNRVMDILLGHPREGDPKLPVQPDPKNPDPSLLTALTVQNIYTIVRNAHLNDPRHFFYPEDIIGDDDLQRDQDLADRIYRNFSAAYPDRATGFQIAQEEETPFPSLKAGLSVFTANNPVFDFRTVSIFDLKDSTKGFNFEGIENPDTFIDEVGTMQRLMLLTTDYPIISALAGKGLVSSLHITQKALPEFIDEFTDLTGSVKNAASLHFAATSTVTFNMARALSLVPDGLFQFDTINSDIPVEDPNSPQGLQMMAQSFAPMAVPPADPYAEWRTLFGSLDSCNCTDCQSIFSPSAYFVDLLQFLKSNLSAVYQELVKRRPDIIDIELTCANTNTTLPQIDIVNELLEDLVSKGFYENGAYKMYARQTIAAANIQRAIPEYVNTNNTNVVLQTPTGTTTVNILTPYPILKNTTYPWTQPYNYFKRQVDGHLELAGVKGYEMSQRFSGQGVPDAWTDYGYITEYLDITKEVFQLLVNPATTAALQTAYGFKVVGGVMQSIADPKSRGTFITVSDNPTAVNYWEKVMPGRVDVLLQQTGLTYRELLELLDCYTLNPKISPTARKMAILKNDPAVGDDTCDLSKLKVDGMDHAVITLLYRFVRLARILGWTYYDMDKAMMGINASNIDSTSFSELGRIAYIARTLNMGVEDTVTLWWDIQQLPYRDYSSSEPKDIPDQYTRIFRNPLLADLDATDYPFQPTPSATPVDIGVVQNYLSGILQIPGSDLKLLLDNLFPGLTNLIPSLGNLSMIYREAVMLKGLQITVQDWLFYKLWIVESTYFGTSPLQPAEAFDNPYDTIRFIAFAKEQRNTGIGTAQVDYLLRDKPLDAAADAAQDKEFSALLTSMRADLLKMYYAEYNDPANDTGSALLQGILAQIMNGDQAAQLVNIIQRVVPPLQSPLYNEADRSFIRDEMSFFLPEGADLLLADNTAPGYMGNITARRGYVYANLQQYILESQLKPYIDNTLAREFGLSPDVIHLLLPLMFINLGGSSYGSGYDGLLLPLFINSNEVLGRWTTTDFKEQYRILLLLDKVAVLAGMFGLDLVDMQYLWDKQALYFVPILSTLPVRAAADILPVPSANIYTPIPYYQAFLFLLYWMQVRAFAGKDMVTLYDALYQKDQGTMTKDDFLKAIAAVFKVNAQDVATLLNISIPGAPANQGVLNLSYSGIDYFSPQLYLRLIDCLEMQHLLPATMMSLYTIAQSVRKACRLLTPATDITQDDVNEVIQVVKAKYSDSEWLDAIRPVNDKLRIERRDALLAYLLVNPPTDYKAQWYTINDIYDTLMLDVEMTPCMPTSRIVLATNTTQLWVDRVLLGLEKYQSGPGTWSRLKLSAVQARQWQTWRNLYRVWEANRKIFIYPENWIEPELRDGKSPFFTELQKFLDQNDITDENVEDAYRTYLERLDEVSHLQIVGIYRETEQDYRSFSYPNSDVLHVFARTSSNPHIYYYRKRVANEWTAWEKMDTQIDGDHFIPVMWRGRLRFYWLVISSDQEQQTGGLSLPGNTDVNMPPAPSRWKVELAWTEYKNGAWSPKQMGKEPLYSNTVAVETPKNIDQIFYYYDDRRNTKRWYFNNFQAEQKRNFNFFCKIDPTGELRFMVWETMTSISNGYLNHQLFAPNSPFNQAGVVPFNPSDPFFYMRKQEYFDKAIRFLQDNKSYMETWPDRVGSFIVKYNGIVAYRPEFENMDPNFYSIIPQNAYEIADTRYHYDRATTVGYAHYPENGMQLLNRAPDTDSGKMDGKYIVFPRQMPQNYLAPQRIGMPYFFYQDYNNSFFVEKTMVSITVQKVLSPSFLVSPALNANFNVLPGVIMMSPFNGIFPAISISNVQGVSSLKYPVFVTMQVPRYRFHNFYHDKVDTFMETLYLKGLDGLLERSYVSGLPDNISFANNYLPTSNVDTRYPKNNIDFDFESSFSLYNWELFFHIPLLIANKLSQNQCFAEARRWYHYVFNPIGGDNASPARFWNFPVFYDNATSAATSSPASIMNDPNLQQNIDRWANDPFKPHLVARTRVTAYMKNTVMKYLDNLIAWADNLFRTDTREAINEATLLYVLAAKLLGRPPVTIPARAKRKTKTYNTLAAAGLNAFSNALVQIESLLLPSGATTVGTVNSQLPVTTGSMFYFCFVPNDKLASYWSIVSDRLFKIRNCMNIDGIERELALFAPPIDPALLVKAAASGLSLADALADMNAPLPLYRFNIMSQKATELTQEVKALGGQLFTALEKKDAEVLALLRSGQEIKVLQASTQVRELQIDDAQAQIDGLQQQKLMTTQRRDYYQRLLNNGLNNQETMQLELMQANIPLSIAQGVMQTLSGALYAIPQITLGVFSFGATVGGLNIGSLIGAGATAMGAISAVNSAKSAMASTRASFLRRAEDWQQQLTVSNTELTQIDKQILGAQIRKSIAETELKNHKLQIQNAQDMNDAMQNKYTNEDLYNWMIGQISFTYFQAYKLAYDMAKRSERSYRNELSLATSDFIKFGYWDSLHKGLLSGEQLAYDIKRMESSFLNLNKRTLELNKDISLAALNPVALMQLRSGQGCEIDLDEWLYDMDYPGQHMRRIKSVSVSIPCAAGPYTTISCKLSLLSSRYRNSPNAPYAESASNFTYLYGNIQSIATSNAQNDSGMFELNFRDERYLPFEGAGAVGKWKIDLPAAYAQFDYASIADVILHIKYTALDNGALAQDAKDNIQDMVKSINTDGTGGLFSIFDPKADFSADWQMLFPETGTGTMVLTGLRERLPYLVQAGANIKVKEVRLYMDNGSLSVTMNGTAVNAIAEGAYYKYALNMNAAITDPLNIAVGTGTSTVLKPSDIGRAWLILHYTVDVV